MARINAHYMSMNMTISVAVYDTFNLNEGWLCSWTRIVWHVYGCSVRPVPSPLNSEVSTLESHDSFMNHNELHHRSPALGTHHKYPVSNNTLATTWMEWQHQETLSSSCIGIWPMVRFKLVFFGLSPTSELAIKQLMQLSRTDMILSCRISKNPRKTTLSTFSDIAKRGQRRLTTIM